VYTTKVHVYLYQLTNEIRGNIIKHRNISIYYSKNIKSLLNFLNRTSK